MIYNIINIITSESEYFQREQFRCPHHITFIGLIDEILDQYCLT